MIKPESYMTADDSFSNEESPVVSLMENRYKLSELVGHILDKYQVAKRYREMDELRWLKSYHNYRGVYEKNLKFRDSEKSRVFVKITKTKVVAAYGHIIEILFGSNKFPLEISETDVPEGVAEFAQVDETNVGNIKEPQKFSSIEEMLSVDDLLGEIASRYKGVNFKEGTQDPQAVTIQPAKQAAEFMNKLILDQIQATDGVSQVKDALFEAVLLGTGVIKGVFTSTKQLNKWVKNEDGTRDYTPESVKVPKIEYVSLWDMFIDPDATRMNDASWVIQRHKMSKEQLRQLASQPFFDKDVIKEILKGNPNYIDEDYELEIRSENSNINASTRTRYEVLEYWGVVNEELLEELGLEIEETEELHDEVPVNVWICDGKVLRVILNPFIPSRIPYQVFCYEKNPYSIYGVGVAENMEDSQAIMNGHARMAIDNLAMAGSLVFDIDESALAPGQQFEVYPGKVFRRQSGMGGQAIYGVKFPNTAVENMQMFDRFRQLADESTGIPSYSHGQTGINSTTRTASGMSMLMGAASLNIKTIIKGIDEDLLKPLGEAFYNWNYAFYEGNLPIRGDLEVKATGTMALMQKEVKSQRLAQLLQTVANPMLAPFAKVENIIKELAKTMDLDPKEFINSPDEAKLYMLMQNGGKTPPAPAQAPNMGVPAAPTEPNFSGNVQQPQAASPNGAPMGGLPPEIAGQLQQ